MSSIFNQPVKLARPIASRSPGRRARTLRGLGDGAAPTPTAEDQINYPFGKYSPQTLVLQNQLNPLLIKDGYCPLIADGKLGPETCGAGAQLLTDNPARTDINALSVLVPSTCEDATLPRKASGPGGCGTGPTATNPDGTPVVPITPASSSKTAGLIAAAVVTLGCLGGYLLYRHEQG